MKRLLISTGEVSGDLQGGLLVEALLAEARRRSIPLEITALGGQRMRRAGAQLLADTAPMGAIGLWEALPLVVPTLRLQRRVNRWLRQTPPDGVVLIDYMGANVGLGLRIRRLLPAVPITYYIAPQEWAFSLGDGGTTRLIGFTDRILAIFPEEARFYGARGAAVTWVGHPLLDTLTELPSREQARSELGLQPDERLLLLLPASRKQELRYLLPPLAAAAAELQRRCPGLRVMVPAGQAAFEPVLKAMLAEAGALCRRRPRTE
jgi:lipid-A-disaccharide synthase